MTNNSMIAICRNVMKLYIHYFSIVILTFVLLVKTFSRLNIVIDVAHLPEDVNNEPYESRPRHRFIT